MFVTQPLMYCMLCHRHLWCYELYSFHFFHVETCVSQPLQVQLPVSLSSFLLLGMLNTQQKPFTLYLCFTHLLYYTLRDSSSSHQELFSSLDPRTKQFCLQKVLILWCACAIKVEIEQGILNRGRSTLNWPLSNLLQYGHTRSGPICRDFSMILKINLTAIFPS